jgi:hypothetical protein
MEAFKAANAGCCLEDFVRWHSPRDWVEIDGKYRLSTRMTDPGSLWQELWASTQRIPASRQRALFDYNQEGQKALHWLEQLSIEHLLR